MSYEDDYIDYLGQRDGALIGGEFGRALREDPSLFRRRTCRETHPGVTLRIPNNRRRQITMAKKDKSKAADKAAVRAAMKEKKRVARVQKRVDKIDKRIAKLQAKKVKLESKRDGVKKASSKTDAAPAKSKK